MLIGFEFFVLFLVLLVEVIVCVLEEIQAACSQKLSDMMETLEHIYHEGVMFEQEQEWQKGSVEKKRT